MSGRTIDDFLTDPDGFNALSQEDQARLLAGESLEGETSANAEEDAAAAANAEQAGANGEASGAVSEESSEAPGAATSEESREEGNESEAVVQAKDGKHVIPFSVLEAERERARQLELENQALKAAQATQASTEQAASSQEEAQPTIDEQIKTVDSELLELRKQHREALYSNDSSLDELDQKIAEAENRRADLIVERRFEQRDKLNSERKAQDDRAAAIAEGQVRAAAAIEKYPFLKMNAPESNQVAIDGVIAERDRLMAQGMSFADAIEKAVEKVAPLFVKTTEDNTGKADLAAKAKEAVTKAKATVPNSLSSAPAGSMAHHDEGEAIRSKSGLSLVNVFMGKSADDIMKQLNRVI